MKKKQIAHRVATGLFIIAILPGAIVNIVQPKVLTDMAVILGVPLALMTLVGIWKLLGVVALLVPGFPKLKEWAYAGFFFDLSGAAILHLAAGDYAGAPGSLVILSILVVSYVLRQRALAS